MRKFYNNNGFTLIEVISVIVIVGIIIPVIYNINLDAWKTWFFNQKKVEFQRTHRLIDLTIGKYARKAYFINDSYGEDNQLKLIYAGGSIIFDKNDNDYFYYTKDTGETKIFSSSKIKNFSYSYSHSEKLLTITVTLTDGDSEYSFTDKYFPRLYKLITS